MILSRLIKKGQAYQRLALETAESAKRVRPPILSISPRMLMRNAGSPFDINRVF